MSEFLDGKTPDRPPRNRTEIATLAMFGLFFGGMLLADLLEDFSVFKLSIPVFIISWVVLLVIHEFGHALMAKALGWRVELVSIGTGKIIARKRILGMPTEFRAVPLSGFALPRPADLIHPRMKNFLIYGAGPGSELAIVAVIWWWVGHERFFGLEPDFRLIALQSFSAAATLGALINLIPFPHQMDEGGKAWSDGLGMIMSWRLSDEYFLDAMRGGDG